ncbi:hypothetical protein IEQ34_009419 [Dendrobium chrysotoxum]|uniref:Uncharacterized protein n=1 Tax=Dendrobium chrysotoxum TaxID=161865 RepID=A0AAV7H1A8_DENCH|nr:hypothetical protein IEQ34_009419 [Dendrobium chrysotoxum]
MCLSSLRRGSLWNRPNNGHMLEQRAQPNITGASCLCSSCYEDIDNCVQHYDLVVVANASIKNGRGNLKKIWLDFIRNDDFLLDLNEKLTLNKT